MIDENEEAFTMYDLTIETIEGKAWRQWRYFVEDNRRQRKVVAQMNYIGSILQDKFIDNYKSFDKLLEKMKDYNATLRCDCQIFDGTIEDAQAKLKQAFFVIEHIIESVDIN